MNRGKIRIDYSDPANPIVKVVLLNGELWLTEYELADILWTYTQTIRAKIKTLLKEGLLDEWEISRDERGEKNGREIITTYYNLDVLIHLCYRINTHPTELLRKWFQSGFPPLSRRQMQEEAIYTGTGIWKSQQIIILN